MAITVDLIYSMRVTVHYCADIDAPLSETLRDSLGNIQEHVMTVLVKHNFNYADVFDSDTGERVMLITRD